MKRYVVNTREELYRAPAPCIVSYGGKPVVPSDDAPWDVFDMRGNDSHDESAFSESGPYPFAVCALPVESVVQCSHCGHAHDYDEDDAMMDALRSGGDWAKIPDAPGCQFWRLYAMSKEQFDSAVGGP